MERTEEQWKEIVKTLALFERLFDRLKVIGLYKPHDAKVISNAIKRGWLRIDLFAPWLTDEECERFREMFPEKERKPQ